MKTGITALDAFREMLNVATDDLICGKGVYEIANVVPERMFVSLGVIGASVRTAHF